MKNRLTVFLCLAMLAALFTVGIAAAECEHNWKEISEVAATCDKEGRVTYKCTLCEKQKIETVKALSTSGTHKWGSTKTTKATCSENGQKTRTCSRCKLVEVLEILPAEGHTYKEKSNDATCEAGGTRVLSCTKCKETVSEKVPAGCAFEFVSTSATCLEKGETTYKCSRCGKYDHETVKALGHDLVKTGGPTCTESGKYVTKCTRCDYSKTSATTSKALGHDVPKTGTGAYKTVVEATCDEEGKRRGKCERCGKYVYETIEKLDHEYSGEYFITKIPTDTEVGKYERICEECGDVLTKTISKGTTNLSRYTVPSVTASEKSSLVEKGTKIELSCALDGATIYYTTDGDSPVTAESRIEYTGAIEINESAVIRAYAVHRDNRDIEYSLVSKFTYLVDEEEKDVVVKMTIDSADADVNGEGKTLDAAPVIKNSRTMLPIRFVAEVLGATVGWDDETRTVSVISEEVIIKIIVGASVAKVDGEEVELDSPAFIDEGNNRTYLPVRFVAEALGAAVEWDEGTKTVTLSGKIKVE